MTMLISVLSVDFMWSKPTMKLLTVTSIILDLPSQVRHYNCSLLNSQLLLLIPSWNTLVTRGACIVTGTSCTHSSDHKNATPYTHPKSQAALQVQFVLLLSPPRVSTCMAIRKYCNQGGPSILALMKWSRLTDEKIVIVKCISHREPVGGR